MRNFYLTLLFGLSSLCLSAQEKQNIDLKKEAPAFKMTRAEENYTYLKDKTTNSYETDVFDAIKYISLSKNGEIYASIGGQFRPRFEHYSNRNWEENENQDFYSQRLALHTNIVLGKHIRIFGELYHGYTSHEKEFAGYDEIDLFQAFAEIKIPMKEKQQFAFRFGRQEMELGATRLVGIREGPNIRRCFDMGKFIYIKGKTKVQAFYGKEVRPQFSAFDNEFSLFNKLAANPQFWGVYTQGPIKDLNGINEIYYLGFQSNNVSFNDVTGEELRHTVGLRRFGKLGSHWKYNTEIIYQFGEIDNNDISAFSIDTDWHYELSKTKWKWTPGLKLEYASGDRGTNDGKVNSFNPMFVNPAYYSLSATITPINVIGIHPSISYKPSKKLQLNVEWAIFWRASENDALYRLTRFVNRPANGIKDRNIGHQFGWKTQYEINRHLSMDLDVSYFIASSFLEKSGESASIFSYSTYT